MDKTERGAFIKTDFMGISCYLAAIASEQPQLRWSGVIMVRMRGRFFNEANIARTCSGVIEIGQCGIRNVRHAWCCRMFGLKGRRGG
jgi:hypothetical protein